MLFWGLQVYDAGDVFMMTYVEEEEDNVDDDDEVNRNDDKQDENTETKPSNQPQLKVVVVKEDGVQCNDPNK